MADIAEGRSAVSGDKPGRTNGARRGSSVAASAHRAPSTWPTVDQSPRKSEPWWQRSGVGAYLILCDVAAFTSAMVLTHPGNPVHVLVLLFLVLVFWRAGLYRSRLNLSLLDDLPYILSAVLVALLFKVALISTLSGVDPPSRQLVHAVVLLSAVLLFRWIAYRVVFLARCRGYVRHRTLIVGAGQLGVRLAATLLDRRYYGLDPVASSTRASRRRRR